MAAPRPFWMWDVFTVLSQPWGCLSFLPGKELKGRDLPSDEKQCHRLKDSREERHEVTHCS